jgi:nucleoside-diphosphate-sugar epimerase
LLPSSLPPLNYIATIKALQVAKELNSAVFIGAGSQSEYGSINGPVDENQLENPVTEYGRFKLKSKQDCENFAKQEDMKFIWTRIFSVYGEYDYENTLIMSCIKKMKKMFALTPKGGETKGFIGRLRSHPW